MQNPGCWFGLLENAIGLNFTIYWCYMRNILPWAFVASTLVISFVNQASAENVNVTFKNSSDWTIDELYLSPSKQAEWGPDQLADKVIKPGESFTLNGVPGGRAMDLKLVDEDGDECVVGKEKLTANTTYNITSQELLACQDDTGDGDDEDA